MFEDESDDALLHAFRAKKDMARFQALYERHAEPLVAFIGSLLGEGHHAVEDVAQITWDQVIDGKTQREGGSTFRTFLIGIARNHCFMQLRAAKRRRRYESRGAEEAMSDAPPQHTVPELADSPFVSESVQKALASLPPEQSKALWMKYVEGMEYEEIAAATGVSVGTAKTRVRLAAEKLAKMGFGPG